MSSNMFTGFTVFKFKVQDDPDVIISGVKAGTGPPLLLLHGFPQTHHIWHIVAPELATQYTVIVPDLRGYGASSKPKGGENHQQYAKSLMARDCKSLMTQLSFSKFYVCAHDRGARVTHKLCVDYPDSVIKAILLDICPTLAMFQKTDARFATDYFHWFFLIQRAPFPENLILQNPRNFAVSFMGDYRYGGLEKFAPGAFDIYVQGLSDHDTVHAMCEDYRAAATVDLTEANEDIKEGRKIKCPLKVLWGKFGTIEKCFDAIGEWKEVSESSVEGEAVPCGHYIPEEVPSVLMKHIKDFLV